jgi:cytidine deaminase
MVSSRSISFTYQEYEKDEVPNTGDRQLIFAAREIAQNAYAPYSKFMVGAAIRLASGQIVTGTNVENAAFPSGICAERSALSHAVSNHVNDKPVAIAIAAIGENGLIEEPVPPCGNCRQVIAEEESRNDLKIRMILAGKNKTIIIESISSLLPLQFNNRNLKINLL